MSTDWQWQHTDRHLCLSWPGQRRCLSSAVLNGGIVEAERILNLRVSGGPTEQQPEQALRDYIWAQGWSGTSVGLMTAASMASLRSRRAQLPGGELEVLVTCGLGNARRAGDPADWRSEAEPAPPAGTINSIFITSFSLPPEVQAEMLMLLTEAKCAALQELGTVSPLTGQTATGTGTDATVVVSGEGELRRWCGKHTQLGEVSARLMIEAVTDSVAGVQRDSHCA